MAIAGEEDRILPILTLLRGILVHLKRASEIAALMADKRLWKDLVVAHLRATK